MNLNIRRRPGVALACVTVMLVASGCGNNTDNGSTSSGSGNPTTGGVLNMLGTGDVDFMDPNISYYSVGYSALRLWSRQLFTYPAVEGQTTTAVPDLATDTPTQANGGISKDGTTYTIQIRKGAMWNTSTPRQVSAEDAVRGLKRTCNPVQPFGGTPDFATLIEGYESFCSGFAKVAQTPEAITAYVDKTPLPGVVAKDASTIEFHLTHPASYFLDMLTMSAFSPAPVEVMKYLPASQELGQHQISDGPYQLKKWTPTKSIDFTRNPAWEAASDPVRKAYVDEVVVNETVSQDSVQQQLQTGNASADMAFGTAPPPSQLPGLIAGKDPNLVLGETASSNPYVIFNNVSPNNSGALKNPDVRQALEYALNRDNLIQVLGGPKVAPPLTHVLPPSIVGSQDNDPYPYDVAKAKSLLAKAGYANGLTLKFLYRNSSEGSSKAFQTVQQDLSKAGIKVTGVASPDADFYTKYLEVPTAASSGVWDLSLAGWGPDWYGDAALSFFGPLFSGAPSYPPTGSNFGFYNDPATNKLITAASSAANSDDAAALWSKADQQVMTDAAFFPITSPLNATYHATQVQNAVYLPAIQNFDPANVWLTAGSQGG